MRVKKNRLKVYKYVWQNFHQRELRILTYGNLTGVEKYIKDGLEKIDPARGTDLIQWYRAMVKAGFINFEQYTPELGSLAISKIFDKYRMRWVNNYAHYKVIASGNGFGGYWPTMNKTKAISEFIARGFVYRDDATEIDTVNKYCIKANIADLWWPKDFETHGDALGVFQRVGISGLTGTTLPKKK